MSTAATASLSPLAEKPWSKYGHDDPILLDLLERTASNIPSVEAIEVFNQNRDTTNTGVNPASTRRVVRETYSDIDSLEALLYAKVGIGSSTEEES